MVVCRFFQQGYCRYGQNCRFDHIYGSKYTYHANPQAQAAPPQPTGSTDESLVTQVQADMQSALRGGQWILSCYSPYKERPNFPGISDLSPEEARLFIYEAKSSNNLEQAITYMNDVFKTTKQKYEQLLQPNANIIKVLRSLYKGEVAASPFTNTDQNNFGASSNTASSIFRSAVNQPPAQNTAASIFSQGQKSIFNSQPDQAKELFSRANNPSIFAQSSPPSNVFGPSNQTSADPKSVFASAVQNTNNQVNPSSIFSSANQSIFGASPSQNTPFNQAPSNTPFGQGQSTSPFGNQNTSPFGQPPTATSPFGQPQNATSPFGQPQNATSPFGQPQNTSPFGQPQHQSSGNVFQKTETPASIFGQANKQIDITNDPGIYSNIEDLSESDLEAFKSGSFELGFVPELPPPYQLCTRAL